MNPVYARYVRSLLLGGSLVLTLFLIIRVRNVLVPFLLALVLAYCLAPLVKRMEDRGLSRAWSILFLYALLGLFLSAVMVWILPDLIREMNRLAETLPGYTLRLQVWLNGMERTYTELGLPDGVRQAIDRAAADLERQALQTIENGIAGILSVFNAVFSIILAPVLAFYLLKDLEFFREQMMHILPTGHRGRWLMLLIRLDRVLSGFIRGQLLLAFFVGAMTWIALSLIGMRFSLMLGLLAAVTEVIPYFGPIIGAVPAIALAALESPIMVIKVIVAYLIIHEIDGAVMGPKILGETVGLHPLSVVFVLLAGGELFGIAGVVLAVPISACFKVIVLFFYDSLTAVRSPPPVPDRRTS